MNTFVKAFLGGVLCMTAAVGGAVAANAISRPGPTAFASQYVDAVEHIQYRNGNYGRRYGGGRYGYRRNNNGRNIGIGIGAAIIGGIILNEAARADHRSSHGDQWDRCAQTYRSFEPSTGMYTGYDGERHTCPYLN
jgi:BA14K-like protein